MDYKHKGQITQNDMEKGLSDFPKHERNPFMEEMLYMRAGRNKIVAAGKIYGTYDQSTGEVQENNIMRSVIVERVDNEQFVKVFDAYLNTLFDLSKRASSVLKYLMNSLKFNDDSVLFSLKEAMKVTGYNSKETIFKGLAELVDKDVIARSDQFNLYFINPKVFVRGNRLDMVKVWVKKNTPEDRELVDSIKRQEQKQRQLSLELNFESERKEQDTTQEAAE